MLTFCSFREGHGDVTGNMTNDNTNTLVYDAENRIVGQAGQAGRFLAFFCFTIRGIEGTARSVPMFLHVSSCEFARENVGAPTFKVLLEGCSNV